MKKRSLRRSTHIAIRAVCAVAALCGALFLSNDSITTATASPDVSSEVNTLDLAQKPERDGKLVWSEEFDGPEVDRDLWTFERGNGHAAGIPGWGNDELQFYTADQENATIENGKLIITARKQTRSDSTGTYHYTSARLHTKNGFTFTHGRVEIRARLPEGQGIWPAIWMLGADIDQVGWPRSGEIDIIELVGDRPDTVHGTLHSPNTAGRGVGGSFSLDDGTRFSQNFHIFEMEWRPDRLTWSVNNHPYFSVEKSKLTSVWGEEEWVFDKPFFFVVNVAVGGRWPGAPDSSTSFPQRLEVDYIRVYELPQIP